MLHWIRSLLHRKDRKGRSRADLASFDRAEIAGLMKREHGLPHVDWNIAEAWLDRRSAGSDRPAPFERALVAGWLDELRDSIPEDCQRWRHELVEGLAPMRDGLAARVATGADRALGIIRESLRKVRGETPIGPVTVVCLPDLERYYSFVSPYGPEEGEFATSGGMFIRERPSFPIICLIASDKHAIEQTLAHELTHHALSGMEMPLWLEEGFTQMMEERVAGVSGFKVDREIMGRHVAHWGGVGLERYFRGEGFSSPENDEQELAYHLSQLIVRAGLTRDAAAFFRFARDAREHDGGESAAQRHLGCSLAALTPLGDAR